MAARPALAARWTNPDAQTWLFHLRPGVKFHSGRPFTSADVVFSFERLQKEPTLEMSAYLSEIASVTAVDALTVRFRTLRPNAILLNSIRFVCIVPSGATRASLDAAVDGTGPYRLAGGAPSGLLTFRRNEAYWGERPYLETVVWRLRRLGEDALADLLSGRSGLAQCNTKTLPRALEGRRDLRMARHTSIFTKFLSFDLDASAAARGVPFADRRVREAVHLAIDRDELTRRLSTFAVPASQPVPPFIFGYDPSIALPRADPARARALLAEAGYPNGFEVPLAARRVLAETAEIVREKLAEVGIRARLEILPDAEFFTRVQSGGVPIFLSRFGCPTGDVNIVLEQWIHSPDALRHLGRSNLARYSNPDLDRAIERSGEIQQMDLRRHALQEIVRAVTAELVWVPLYFDDDVYAFDARYAWEPRNDSYVSAAEIAPAKP